MKMQRRSFLRGAGALLLPAALPGCGSDSDEKDAGTRVDFGELVADGDGLLDLPEGFRYVVLERTGDEMSDGLPMGGAPDGMACFEDEDGHYVLMRNHEMEAGAAAVSAVAFDNNRAGGVSRVLVNRVTLERVSSNWVLTGTTKNCAGGPSPWGWLSCEETDEPGHGYVFVCDPEAGEARAPQRARSFGRFKHEAAAVDPSTHCVYLTEDDAESALYRHVPEAKDSPFVGRLEALKIVGQDALDLGKDLVVGDSFEIEWVKVDDPEAESEPTAAQAHGKGAAVVRRGEGIWFGNGSVYFVSTSGGPLAKGQIFSLTPSADGGVLTLVAQAEDEDGFVNPDNVTVAPWGDLVVAEDNDGPNYVRGVRSDGSVYPLVRNALAAGASEFCGACFSPDGKVLFVNIQDPGITVAITGPFPSS